MTSKIQIPEHLRDRPRDELTGLPIPFIALVNDEGEVQENGVDIHQWFYCVNGKRCSFCGKPHEYWIFFIGDEKNEATRLFPNPPMHRECAEFALNHLTPKEVESVLLFRTREAKGHINGGLSVKSEPFKGVERIEVRHEHNDAEGLSSIQ